MLARFCIYQQLTSQCVWSVMLMLCWDVSESCSRLLGLTTERMSEGENKQAPDTAQEVKPESMAAAPAGQSMSPPVSMVTQPPAAAATEDEEEESEDESEILEESPCGRWQKRREEVGDVSAGEAGLTSTGPRIAADALSCLLPVGESAQCPRYR